MILIVTFKNDYTADFIINKLNDKKINYFRFNTDDPPFSSLDINVNTQLIHSNLINSTTSIWYRRLAAPTFDENDPYKNNYLSREYQFYLSNLFSSIKTRWMSYPQNINLAENKLLQLEAAKNLNLKIPKTLISANKSTIEKFIYSNPNRTIIKPLHINQFSDDKTTYSIFTNIVTSKDLQSINDPILFPAIYQEYIEKSFELRITVVGNKYFAAKVDSQNNIATRIDWRKQRLKFEPINIPIAIGNKCIDLVKHFNLAFSAIDMVVDKNGDYYFLESNPNGQWAWIEIDTALPISDSIIEYLSGKNNEE